MTIIIIIIVLLLLIYYFWPDDPKRVYEKIGGYENTPQIRSAVKKLKNKRKKNPEDNLMLGDMYRYNLNDQILADQYYAEGLQLALFENDPIIYAINDRVTDVPIEVPAGIPKIKSDPQNVHDSNVVQQLRDRYYKIRTTAPDIVGEFIVEYNLNIGDGHIHGLGSEREILNAVLHRGKHIWPVVADNIKNMGDICVTGRVSQYLDALTLLDPVGTPIVTTDILRKEIFQEFANEMKNPIFETGSDQEISDHIEKFAETIGKRYIDAKPEVLEKILTEAKAAF